MGASLGQVRIPARRRRPGRPPSFAAAAWLPRPTHEEPLLLSGSRLIASGLLSCRTLRLWKELTYRMLSMRLSLTRSCDDFSPRVQMFTQGHISVVTCATLISLFPRRQMCLGM
jgi:hypothetical protein